MIDCYSLDVKPCSACFYTNEGCKINYYVWIISIRPEGEIKRLFREVLSRFPNEHLYLYHAVKLKYPAHLNMLEKLFVLL